MQPASVAALVELHWRQLDEVGSKYGAILTLAILTMALLTWRQLNEVAREHELYASEGQVCLPQESRAKGLY